MFTHEFCTASTHTLGNNLARAKTKRELETMIFLKSAVAFCGSAQVPSGSPVRMMGLRGAIPSHSSRPSAIHSKFASAQHERKRHAIHTTVAGAWSITCGRTKRTTKVSQQPLLLGDFEVGSAVTLAYRHFTRHKSRLLVYSVPYGRKISNPLV